MCATTSAARARAGSAGPSAFAQSSNGQRDAQGSSTHPGFWCNPSADSPPPSARSGVGSPRPRSDGPIVSWRTSTCARSAVDASAESYRASQSSPPAQQTTPEMSPPPRQTAPLLVAESESSARELTPEDAILLDQIGDDVLLLVIQPVGQGGQNNPYEHAVNHGAESTLATGLRASQLCRRACGTLRAPTPRRIQDATEGRVIEFAEVGGLHH